MNAIYIIFFFILFRFLYLVFVTTIWYLTQKIILLNLIYNTLFSGLIVLLFHFVTGNPKNHPIISFQYCDSQGFPKLNDEYLVQSMFRAMYKYDLADSEAFDEWKEDESEDHPGKMQAIIQTTDWFNWLQDDDDDDDDDDEGEDYDEEEE